MAANDSGTEVDLSRRNLYAFPTYLTKGSGITRLQLQVNMLKSLPPELANMQGLEEICCSNNQFEEFPDVICDLADLKSLDFAGNGLKVLPAAMANLKNLTKLRLGWNNFQEFPLTSCLDRLTQLTELHICNNNIADLPHDISDLKNLEIFDLSHNKVQEIPATIGRLSNLRTLDISYNKICQLPGAVCDLQNLKTLKASCNNIASLPENFGESLQGVTVLNLGDNPLEYPPLDVCQRGVEAIRQYQERRGSAENDRKNGEMENAEIAGCYVGRGNDPVRRTESKSEHEGLGGRKTRHHMVSDNGKVSAKIDPNDVENHVIHVSTDIELEVSSDAVKEEVDITAEFVEYPSCPLELGDHEFIVTDFLDLGPDGLNFKEPLIFNFKCADHELEDKTREIVVRTTNSDGTWSDVKTWKEGSRIKAEVDHFSGLVAVSKPKQHSVVLTDINSLSVSCVQNDISVDVETPKENKNVIRMLMELQNVEHDTLLRACELVGEYDDDFIAMGTILKIQQDAEEFKKPISLTLPLPVMSEVNHVSVEQLRKRGILKVLRDCNDDNWHDVTDDVIHHMTTDRCMSFTERNLHWPCCRYVTVFAERGVNIEAIAQMATRMARKGWKIVNLVLLQNVKNPKSLYVDCVVKEKLQGLLDKLLNTGYEARGNLPYTRDIDLQEGEKVVLEVGGENIHSPESKKSQLTFYSRRDNHVMLHATLDNDAFNDVGIPGEDCTGFVNFLKFRMNIEHTKNINEDDMMYDRLWFGIPRPESPNSPKLDTASQSPNEAQKFTFDMTTEGIDIAIDILSSRLLQRDWRRLARKLGLKDVDINALEHNFPGDLREQIHQMFQQWLQREGESAAVETLIAALDDLQIRNLCHAVKRCLGLVKENIGPARKPLQRPKNLPELKPLAETPRPTTQHSLRKYRKHRKSEQVDGRKSSLGMTTRTPLPMAAISVPMGVTAGKNGSHLIYRPAPLNELLMLKTSRPTNKSKCSKKSSKNVKAKPSVT